MCSIHIHGHGHQYTGQTMLVNQRCQCGSPSECLLCVAYPYMHKTVFLSKPDTSWDIKLLYNILITHPLYIQPQFLNTAYTRRCLSEIILTFQGNIILVLWRCKMSAHTHTHTHTHTRSHTYTTDATADTNELLQPHALPTVAKVNENASENNHRLLLLRFGKVTENREEMWEEVEK
jgi:hypothetical protein